MLIDVVIKNYPKEAEKLIEIWEAHSNSIDGGLEFITFINTKPKNTRNKNRKISGFDAKAVNYLGECQELIKMSVENFVYLMIKCGVEIDIVNIDKEDK